MIFLPTLWHTVPWKFFSKHVVSLQAQKWLSLSVNTTEDTTLEFTDSNCKLLFQRKLRKVCVFTWCFLDSVHQMACICTCSDTESRNGSASWKWEFGFNQRDCSGILWELTWNYRPDHGSERLDANISEGRDSSFLWNVSLCKYEREIIETHFVRPKVSFRGDLRTLFRSNTVPIMVRDYMKPL